MTKTLQIAFPALATLLLLCGEASAQILIRPRRPPLTVPSDHRPALGVVFGPSARAAESESDGVDAAVVGEIPLHDGLRGRIEAGLSSWKADPATESGVSRLTLTRATAGLYRVSGRSPVHAFVGGGLGLFRHRPSGRRASGSNAGLFGGFGMEYVGRRRAFSTEVRVGLISKPGAERSAEYPAVLHGSLLVGVKRVF